MAKGLRYARTWPSRSSVTGFRMKSRAPSWRHARASTSVAMPEMTTTGTSESRTLGRLRNSTPLIPGSLMSSRIVSGRALASASREPGMLDEPCGGKFHAPFGQGPARHRRIAGARLDRGELGRGNDGIREEGAAAPAVLVAGSEHHGLGPANGDHAGAHLRERRCRDAPRGQVVLRVHVPAAR